MNKLDATKYRPFYNISLLIPQVYDDTLSYYESLCRLSYALNSLVNQLNAKWTDETTQLFNEYLANLLNANVEYTEKDQGLHLNITTGIASGDHLYDSETQTMTITEETGENDESTFEI